MFYPSGKIYLHQMHISTISVSLVMACQLIWKFWKKNDDALWRWLLPQIVFYSKVKKNHHYHVFVSILLSSQKCIAFWRQEHIYLIISSFFMFIYTFNLVDFEIIWSRSLSIFTNWYLHVVRFNSIGEIIYLQEHMQDYSCLDQIFVSW